jgi:four helix bundle protein
MKMEKGDFNDGKLIPSHYKLTVWRDAIDLVSRIYRLTRRMPRSERFGLISQLQRSAVSIPSNIAEGAGRGGASDTIRFFKIARGSLMELDTQLLICRDLELLDEAELPRELIRKVYGKINRLITYRESRRES